MTDPAELAKELRLWAEDDIRGMRRDLLLIPDLVTVEDLTKWADLMDRAAAYLDAMSDSQKHIVAETEDNRLSAEEVREAAAKLSESHATCGCGGKQGWCNEDGWPLAIAEAIRAMPLTK